MTKPNVLDGNEVREMTDSEHAAYVACFVEVAKNETATQLAATATAAARASALAKLAELGLTDDEISALVG
jgi:hypothetical protein